VKFGCGGFFEWGYLQAVIDRCGDNLGWAASDKSAQKESEGPGRALKVISLG
jgi:hypothetical protein